MRLPHSFREGHSGDLACPHRDVSCCSSCAHAHPEIVEVYGQHFWVADLAERVALKASTSKIETKPRLYLVKETP